jgi:hypothetical protein
MDELLVEDDNFFHISTRELSDSLNQLKYFLEAHINQCYALKVEPESHLVRQAIDIRDLADRLRETSLERISIRK